MKKLIDKIRIWNGSVVRRLKDKYKSKGWTYLKLVEDYFHLSILFLSGLLLNIALIIAVVLLAI